MPIPRAFKISNVSLLIQGAPWVSIPIFLKDPEVFVIGTSRQVFLVKNYCYTLRNSRKWRRYLAESELF